MKYFKIQLLSLIATTILFSCIPSQKIQVAKSTAGSGGPQTLVYSLPKTRIDINVLVTKVTTKAGPYAAYAEKYLTLKDVPVNDSEVFEITKVQISPVSEPDPEHFYAISFKSYPSNLDKLFTMTQEGYMLDLQNSWKQISYEYPSKNTTSGIAFERSIYDQVVVENIDTLYKTVMKDAAFVKVPIYKKSMEIKNEEDKAEDMANLILKLRKRRLKLMMGEYDYHPDGAALKVIVEELGKQEEELMSHFTGKKITETTHYSFSITPSGATAKDIAWFSEERGISETAVNGAKAISVSIETKGAVATNSAAKATDKTTNGIYFRPPVTNQVSVKMGNKILAEGKIPVYQSGALQVLPVMP